MPKVAIIGTGGTISSIGFGPLDLLDYAHSGEKMTIEQVVDKFPHRPHEAADLTLIPYKAVGSPEIGPPHWLDLTRMVHETVAADPSLDGVVITHGTATTEETAYFLNLSLKCSQAVVVVGAQRPASAESTDAALNLYNAIRTAAAPQSRGMGVLVLLNDEIQSAREVTKTSTLRLQTFRTPRLSACSAMPTATPSATTASQCAAARRIQSSMLAASRRCHGWMSPTPTAALTAPPCGRSCRPEPKASSPPASPLA